jgi:uncharacterized protein (UPF0548 family)
MRFPDFSIGEREAGRRLRALRGKALNFDPAAAGGPGWSHDDYRQPLAREAPGPPEPGGTWERARQVSREFAFTDPSLVEARFDATLPLEERDLLLIIHLLGVRLYAGTRVGGSRDELVTVDGRTAQLSSWNYRTLEGHVEAGQRDYEVWKWLDTGEVEFRTHSFSRPGDYGLLVRAGIRLLGPHKQVEFGRGACRRMLELTS